MSIRIQQFGGVIPRMDPGQLPDEGAQRAQNVDLTGGVLAPLNLTGPFSSLHEDDGSLISGVPVEDVFAITKPDAPTVANIEHICKPTPWLRIWVNDWITYIHPVSGVWTVDNPRSHPMPIMRLEYTETGLTIQSYLVPVLYTFPRGGPYKLLGPRYRFGFLTDPDQENGGANTPQVVPEAESEGDPEWSRQRVPLVDQDDNVYAQFQVTDVSGPKYDENYLVEDMDYYYVTKPSVPAAHVYFKINLNYTEASRRHFYFVQTMLSEDDEEGPPSEKSAKITLEPGERLTLNTPRSDGFPNNRVYRSTKGGNADFSLLDDVDADSYVDTKVATLGDPIPPFGNLPVGVDVETFLEGSVRHPAHYALAFHNSDGKGTLYPSDTRRFWVWPLENALPFVDDIDAIVLTGGTTLVFSGGEVRGVSGSNPAALSNREITKTAPLRSKASSCQIGQTGFWSTDDGLAASNGASVQILTAHHFTRAQWAFFNPSAMVAETADGAVLIKTTTIGAVPNNLPWAESGQALNLRFDIDEGLQAVSLYTAETGGTVIWQSKRFSFDKPTVFDWVAVDADVYPVTLKAYANREQVTSLSIEDRQPHLINLGIAHDGTETGGKGEIPAGGPVGGTDTLPHADEWSFEVQGTGVIRRIDAYDRQVVTMTGDEVRFTPENTPVWQGIWVKFPEWDRFCGGVMSVQTDGPVPVRFYADGELVHEALVSNGRFFPIPRTVRKGTLWRIEVDTEGRVDELVLFRTRTKSESGDFRIAHGGGIPEWQVTRFEFVGEAVPRSVRVFAEVAGHLRLYYDGATEPSATIEILDRTEVTIPVATYGALEMDYNGSDAHVSEILFHVSETATVGGDGVFLTGQQSYRNLEHAFLDRNRFVCASVLTDDYTDVRLTLAADGAEVYSEPVLDPHVFRLPRTLEDATLWKVDVPTSSRISRVMLLPLQPVDVDRTVSARNPRSVAPWLFRRYRFPRTTELVSIWLDASEPVPMRIYVDGEVEAAYTETISPRVETLIDVKTACGALEFDFTGQDHKVSKVSIFAEDTMDIGASGVHEGHRPNWRGLQYKSLDKLGFGVASLSAADYDDVKFKLRADDRQVFSKTVRDGELFHFPRGMSDGSVWTVDVKTDAEVRGLHMFPITPFQAGLGVRETNTDDVAPWLVRRYELDGLQELQSVTVASRVYPVTMQFFFDGESSTAIRVTIPDGSEQLLTPPRKCSAVGFRFGSNDRNVRRVTLTTHQTTMVGDAGVNMVNPTSHRGVQVRFEEAGTWACAVVGLSEYALAGDALTLTADGTHSYAQDVTSGAAIQFPRSMEEGGLWEIDLATLARVQSLRLRPWQRVNLGAGPIRPVRPENGVAPWLHTRWELPDRMFLKSAIVHASSYPLDIRFFLDEAGTVSETVTIEDNREFRLSLAQCSAFDFDFDGADADVTEVLLFPRTHTLIGDTPVPVRGPSSRGVLYRFAEKGALACLSVGMTDAAGWVVVKLYADGVEVYKKRVPSGVIPFPLTLEDAALWEVDCEPVGDARIESLVIYPWRRKSATGGVHAVARVGAVAPHWYTKWDFKTPTTLRSGRMKGATGQTLKLYADDNFSSPAATTAFEDMTEFLFKTPATFQTLVARPHPDTSRAYELFLFGEDTQEIENHGLIVRNAGGQPAWRNKVIRFKEMGTWSVARVVATDYTGLTLSLRPVGGSTWNTWTVTGNGEFKLDHDDNGWTNLENARDWELSMVHTGDIEEVHLFAQEIHQVDAEAVVVRRDGGPWTWLAHRVRADRPVSWGVCRVLADAYPVLIKMSVDGAKSIEITALDGRGFRLPRRSPQRDWTVDLEAEPGTLVTELALATSMQRLRKIG